MRYKNAEDIPVVFFLYGSAYDYHFIIKELVEEFIEQFECLRENTYKYKTFLVSIKKEFDIGKTITYRIKLVYSFRFMSSSLLYLADNVSERLHNCKYTDCKSCLEYISTKNEIFIFNCLKCSKSHESILIKISLKDLQTHMNSAMETLINLFCY